MSQPGPLTAVLIGSDESVSQKLRLEAASRAMTFSYEFANVGQALEQLPRNAAERLVFFFEVRTPSELADLGRLSNVFPGHPIAAVFTDKHDSRAIVDAMRAGAAQVIPFPLDRGDLVAAIDRLRIQFGETGAPLRSISICGVHKGVGATTLTLNLAHALVTTAGLDLRCLIGESTRSAGTISSYLGLNPRCTVKDVIDIVDRLDSDLLRKCLTDLAPNLYLLPAPREGLSRFATDEEYGLFERLLPQIVNVAIGNVGILVGGHFLAFLACLLDQGDGIACLAKGGLARGLQVRDVDRQACFPADLQRFLNGRQQAGAFISNVADVKTAMAGRNLGQRNQLAGVGVGSWVVDQAGREGPGAVLHRLVHQLLHAFQLLGRGRPVGITHDLSSNIIVRHEVNDIGADGEFFQLLEIGRSVHGAPAAVAGDHRRDALRKIVSIAARLFAHQRTVAVSMKIDETWCHDQASGIDHARLPRGFEGADGDNPVAAERHIALFPGLSAAVVNRAAL